MNESLGSVSPLLPEAAASLKLAQLMKFMILNRVIDPSAGSPTETLLRLLLPLSDKVYQTFQHVSK